MSKIKPQLITPLFLFNCRILVTLRLFNITQQKLHNPLFFLDYSSSPFHLVLKISTHINLKKYLAFISLFYLKINENISIIRIITMTFMINLQKIQK